MSHRASSDQFEMWLLRRVAEAVEAGEVSVDLLVELQGELGVSRARHPEVGHATALRSLVDLLEVDSAVEEGAQTHRNANREQLLRDVAEIWLTEQRKAYRRQGSPRRS